MKNTLTKKQKELLEWILSAKNRQYRVDWQWSLSGKSRSCFIEQRWIDRGFPQIRTTTIFSTSNDELFKERFAEVKRLVEEK